MKMSYVKRMGAVKTGTGMHVVVRRRTLTERPGQIRHWALDVRHYTAVTAASFARAQRAQEVTA